MDKAANLAEKAKSSLDKFSDTLKLKLHLASMESKSSLESLEKQFGLMREDLQEFSKEIRQEAQEARLKGHLALMDAKVRWEGIREDLDDVIGSISGAAEKKLDNARLKASLAKLEARDLIDRVEYEKHFHNLGKNIKEEWHGVLETIDKKLVDFTNRFP